MIVDIDSHIMIFTGDIILPESPWYNWMDLKMLEYMAKKLSNESVVKSV